MKQLKEILDKGLSNKWNLSQKELSDLWGSISASMPATPKSRGLFYWGVAAAVAAVAVVALFLMKTPSSPQTPFQPENTPIEKTTTLADRNGEKDALAGEEETQMPVLAHSKLLQAFSQQGTSEEAQMQTAEEVDEVPQSTEVGEQKSTEKEEPAKEDFQLKPSIKAPSGKLPNRSSNFKGYSRVGSSGKLAFAISSNLSGRRNIDGPSASMAQIASAYMGYDFYSTTPQIQDISQTKYSLPLSIALNINYRVGNMVTLGTGLSYTYLQSKYKGIIGGQFFDIKQGVHYIGIPLNVYFNFAQTNNMNFYALTGGSIEKGVLVKYRMSSLGHQITSTNSHVKGVQFSVRGGAGFEYKLGKSKKFGIYVEPNVVYYFDSKLPGSIRTDQPLQFEAQAGVRFHLR